MREKIVDRVGEVSNNLTLLSLDLETLGDVMTKIGPWNKNLQTSKIRRLICSCH